MEFEIKKGIEPTAVNTAAAIYDPLRLALMDAGVGQWLHVDVPAKHADRVSNSVSSGSNTLTMKALREAGYKTRTAVRYNKHDRTIPLDMARVFFCKVRAG